jgi:prepilin-type processing-associated H-X9-DG protein
MSELKRPRNTFYAFCSLLLPGLGQLLQKRPGAAVGFFGASVLTGYIPFFAVVNAVASPIPDSATTLLMFWMFFPLLVLIISYSVLDAAIWKKGERTPFKIPLVALICVYFFLVLPAYFLLVVLPAAHIAATRRQCSNHIKQIVLAFHHYKNEHGHFPPAYTVDEKDKPLHSWRVLILPYLEQNDLYEKIRLDESWDSEHNRQFHSAIPSSFQCPNYSRLESIVPTRGGCNYSIIYGTETAFSGSQPRKTTKKLSDTIFLVERRVPVNWMDPSREISFEVACQGVNVDAMGISSYHPGGVHCGFGDGSVRFVTNTVDGKTLRKLLMLGAE